MGNINRYTVAVWVQIPGERRGTLHVGHEAGFRRLSSAYRYARRMQRTPIVTTYAMYQVDTRGASFANIEDTGRMVDTVDQPVEFVPSVGELGYTP